MDFLKGLLGAFPSAITQGLIWGIMAIGVYITYKIQDIADLTVDGSLCTGSAIFTMLMTTSGTYTLEGIEKAKMKAVHLNLPAFLGDGSGELWIPQIRFVTALVVAAMIGALVGVLVGAAAKRKTNLAVGISCGVVVGLLCGTGIWTLVILMLQKGGLFAVSVSLLCAVLTGALCGTVTGLFHISLGIPAILAGILTQLILWSVNLKIMGKANVALPGRNYPELLLKLSDIPKSLLVVGIFTVVLIGILYLFFGTELGASIRSTGSNAAMSRAQGINTDLMKVIGLALSNGLVALSGALLCQYQGYSDINMGRGAIVIGLAAVIIGEAVFRRITRNFALTLLGVSLGAVIYFMVYQAVIYVGLDADLLKMFSALVVAVFLGAPYLRSRFFRKKKKKSKEEV